MTGIHNSILYLTILVLGSLSHGFLTFDSHCESYYHIERIGDNSLTEVKPMAINSQGAVSGYFGTVSQERAFRWTPSSGLSVLNVLESDISSLAYDINDTGHVVGTVVDRIAGNRAVLWTNENNLITLMPYSSGKISVALTINNRGQIAGSVGRNHSKPSSGEGGVLWSVSRQIVPINVSSNWYGDPKALNQFGILLVNVSRLNRNPLFPRSGIYVWKLTDGPASETSHVIPELVGGDINDKGTVVGYWNGKGFFKDGITNPVVLPDFGGEASWANAINNRGQIVGWAQTPGGDPIKNFVGIEGLTPELLMRPIYQHACLWENNNICDLNNLVPEGSGWELVVATGINDQGHIIGEGKFNNESAAFLLSPK